MGEPRRIELMPVEPTENLIPEKKKAKKRRSTLRFDLPLAESTEKICPEFSYARLVKKALEEKKKKKEENKEAAANGFDLDPDDPFAEEDAAEHDKLLAIAQSFESKYAPKPGKKKKYDRVQDLIDLGDGYDEDDPFIDNTEAYDEIVPASLTTKHGGFYINCGVLDFREVSDDSDDDFQKSPMMKKKKKVKKITSDSESEIAEPKKRGRPKKKREGEELFKEKKRKKKKLSSSSQDGDKPKKKKLIHVDGIKKKRGRPKIKNVPPTVAELIKQVANPTSSENGFQTKQASSDIFSTSSDADDSKAQPASSNNIDSAIDSVIAAAAAASTSPEDGGKPEKIPDLPSPLPSSLAEGIDKLKKAAAEKSEEGKCKFFSSTVNKILLDVELASRQLPTSQRTVIYNHLAAFLPCGVQTLLKRAKKLRQNEHDDRLKEPIEHLKEAISRVLPAQLDRYNAECAAAILVRKQDDNSKDGMKEAKEEGASTESDEEEKKAGDSDKGKRFVLPRKKFEWTDLIRSLLCSVVRIKMEMFELSKDRSQSPEEYLKHFLEAEIKNLWPKGWIQTRMLFKESRSAHMRWTHAQNKPVKKPGVLTAPSKPNTPISTPVGTPISTPSSTPTNQQITAMLGTSPGMNLTSSTTKKEEKTNLFTSLMSSSVLPAVSLASTPVGAATAGKESIPTLLDYASESFFSKGKTTSKSEVTESAPKLSFKTTNTLGSLNTPATEALKNMSMFVEKTEKQEPVKRAQVSPLYTSPKAQEKTTYLSSFQAFAAGFTYDPPEYGQTGSEASKVVNTSPQGAHYKPKTVSPVSTIHSATKTPPAAMQSSMKTPLAGMQQSVKTPLAGMQQSVKTPLAGMQQSVKTPLAGMQQSVKTSLAGMQSSVKTTHSGTSQQQSHPGTKTTVASHGMTAKLAPSSAPKASPQSVTSHTSTNQSPANTSLLQSVSSLLAKELTSPAISSSTSSAAGSTQGQTTQRTNHTQQGHTQQRTSQVQGHISQRTNQLQTPGHQRAPQSQSGQKTNVSVSQSQKGIAVASQHNQPRSISQGQMKTVTLTPGPSPSIQRPLVSANITSSLSSMGHSPSVQHYTSAASGISQQRASGFVSPSSQRSTASSPSQRTSLGSPSQRPSTVSPSQRTNSPSQRNTLSPSQRTANTISPSQRTTNTVLTSQRTGLQSHTIESHKLSYVPQRSSPVSSASLTANQRTTHTTATNSHQTNAHLPQRSSVMASEKQTPHKLSSLTTSLPMNQPVYQGGLTLNQLQAQAMAVANQNKVGNRATQGQSLNVPSSPTLWRTAEQVTKAAADSSQSAFNLVPQGIKNSAASTGIFLSPTVTSSIARTSGVVGYQGLGLIDQPVGHLNSHNAMQLSRSPESLLPPGSGLFGSTHSSVLGTPPSPHHRVSPQSSLAVSPVGLLPGHPLSSPYGLPYSDPQGQHRY